MTLNRPVLRECTVQKFFRNVDERNYHNRTDINFTKTLLNKKVSDDANFFELFEYGQQSRQTIFIRNLYK